MSNPYSDLEKKLNDHLLRYADHMETVQQLNARLTRAELEVGFLKEFVLSLVAPNEVDTVREIYAEKFAAHLEKVMIQHEKSHGAENAALLDSYLRPSELLGQPQSPPGSPDPERPA